MIHLPAPDKEVTRRGFMRTGALLLGGAVLLPSINGCLVESEPQEVTDIRRKVGEWTTDEVEFLATEMIKDTQYNDISYAGGVLLGNQKGEHSLSKISYLFNNRMIKFKSVKMFADPQNPVGVTPMKTEIARIGTPLEITLKSKKDESTTTLFASPYLQFEGISINYNPTKEYSNFLFKFSIATQMSALKATDMVTSFLLAKSITPKFYLPDDLTLIRALQVSLLFGENRLDEMPTSYVAETWSHFLMLPNFNLALEQGEFSIDEVKKYLGFFEDASQMLRKKDVLIRNSTEKYEWTTDEDKFFRAWIDVAKEFYQGPQVPTNGL